MNATDTPVPVAVAGGHQFVSIEGSYSQACGLTANGDIYCWGFTYGNAHFFGGNPAGKASAIGLNVKLDSTGYAIIRENGDVEQW